MEQKLLRAPKQILVDGDSVRSDPAAAWRGLGFVSANGSSRLLLDYKLRHPEVYQEILRLLFAPGEGAGLSHLKIELGADVNSSSGTEPCTMRSPGEPADVTRGAGFQLAADARKINPDLTLDLLRWGEPRWVTDAFAFSREAGYAARYKWYAETLKAAYRTYGLTFDFISPDANETEEPDADWLIYFASHLHREQNPPYDFKRIRIVASDEVGSRKIAAMMLENEALRNTVDVIGLHYTTYGDENTALLHEQFGKEIWYSEGIAPCNVPELSCRADGNGLSGKNGPIDVANRIIGSYPHGKMVMYEFQPAVSAYYPGSCYAPKQLITANEPWSGHFSVDIGFWIASHFTRFAKPGWGFAETGCFGDGEENHTITGTTNSYLSMVSPDKKHVTVHIANDSDVPRSYLVVCKNLAELPKTVYLIETAGSAEPTYTDENWFSVAQVLRVRPVDGEAAFPVVCAPHSIITATTMDVSRVCGTQELQFPVPQRKRLTLPYTDRFDYAEDVIRSRGGAPLYMTDQGGAFEVVHTDDANYLEQKITKDHLPTNWRFRGTPEPITLLGDDLWANYQAVTEGIFESDAADNYIGIGIRHNSAVTCPDSAACGISLRLYATGKFELRYMDEVLETGEVPDFVFDKPHKIGIGALGALVLCFADGHSICEKKLSGSMVRSGRISLQSAYYRNRFLSVTAEEMPVALMMPANVSRADCLSEFVTYAEGGAEGAWTLEGMAPYQCWNRTCAIADRFAVAAIRFYGNAVSLLGRTEDLSLAIWIDGELYSSAYRVQKSNWREAFFTLENLHEKWHTLRIQVLDGMLELDSFEVPSKSENPDYARLYLPPDPTLSEAQEEKRRGFDLKQAALPLAGAAAAGVAAAYTLGRIGRKLGKRKK